MDKIKTKKLITASIIILMVIINGFTVRLLNEQGREHHERVEVFQEILLDLDTSIRTLRSTNNELIEQKDNLRNKYENIKEELMICENNKTITRESLQEITMMYNSKEGLILTPTSNMVRNFLRNDKTQFNRYVEHDYNCQDFSYEMVSNAREKGMFGCVYTVTFDSGAHQLVAFNTEDKGIMFVEPQSNKVFFDLSLGDNYCNLMNWRCEDRTITKITGCW